MTAIGVKIHEGVNGISELWPKDLMIRESWP